MIFIPNWRKADFEHDKGGKLFRKDFVQRCRFDTAVCGIMGEIHLEGNRNGRREVS